MPVPLKTPEAETISSVIQRHAQDAPDSPALVADGQRPLTYADLARLMARIQQRLNAMGYGREDRIAIIGKSDSATAAAITGIWGCATAVPMNPSLSPGEFAIYLRDLKVQAVAIDAELDTAARGAAQKLDLPILEVVRTDPAQAGIIDIRSAADPRKSARPGAAQAEDIAMVLQTSGTTSHSKTIPLTQRHISARCRLFIRAAQLTAQDRCLNLMPLFHGHGLYPAFGATLYSGGSLATLPEFSIGDFFRLLVTLSPTWYTGSYTFHHTICAAAPDHMAEIGKSRLRFIRTASGHLDPQIIETIERIFRVPLIVTYSCTEAHNICMTPFPPARRKRGTVGIPLTEVAIIGPDKQFLPQGERGEVVVDTATVFGGYENDPAANAEAFFDGWFRTGDEGFLDEEGYLTLTGRIKDIINRGGEKITPSEVDNALMGHPDVSAAVTFPVPHATLGEDVAAAVVPAKGAVLTDEILARYLRGKISAFKVPRRILIVDEIPKGATGKYARRGLFEAFGLSGTSADGRSQGADDRPPTPLEEDLQRMWSDVLAIKSVGLYDNFFTMGGDSLQAVELFLRIEEELGRRLPRSVLFEADTVAKMAELINKATTSPCLVPIQPKGDNLPFFCVHDGEGHVLNFRDLARLVGEAQPFYGIQCRGLDGEEEPFTHIEDMASYYVGEMRKVQPEGPYYIGGYSFGGRVAYVMAQQLSAAGEEVALLALLDTFSHMGESRVGFRDWLAHHRERLKTLRLLEIPAYLGLRVVNLADTAYQVLRMRGISFGWRFIKSRGWPIPGFLRLPVATNQMIRQAYQAEPYGGDATLFKAEKYAWTHTDAHDGWRELIKGNLEIRPITGRHFEIVKQPHVQKLAAELADALKQARAAHAEPVGPKVEAID